MVGELWWMSPSTCAEDIRGNRLATYAADDLPEHGYPVAGDETADLAPLTNDNLGTGHITFKLAVDFDFVLADNLHALANKFEVILDDLHPSCWQSKSPEADKLDAPEIRFLHVFDGGYAVHKIVFRLGRGASAPLVWSYRKTLTHLMR